MLKANKHAWFIFVLRLAGYLYIYFFKSRKERKLNFNQVEKIQSEAKQIKERKYMNPKPFPEQD